MLNLNILSFEQAQCLFYIQHLFFTCYFSWQVWLCCFKWWGISAVLNHNPLAVVRSWNFILQNSGKFKRGLCNSMFAVIIWSIRFERNQVKFQRKVVSVEDLKLDVRLRLGIWVKCYEPSFPYSIVHVSIFLSCIWNWKKYAIKYKSLFDTSQNIAFAINASTLFALVSSGCKSLILPIANLNPIFA